MMLFIVKNKRSSVDMLGIYVLEQVEEEDLDRLCRKIKIEECKIDISKVNVDKIKFCQTFSTENYTYVNGIV